MKAHAGNYKIKKQSYITGKWNSMMKNANNKPW